MLLNRKGQKLKVLIIPSYSTYGGTLTFLLQLLKFHQNNHLETAVLIPENQAYPFIIEYFESAKVKVFIEFSRSALFFKPYFSLLFDFVFCWRTYWRFRPDVIVISEGSYDLMFGALVYPVPVIFALHTAPSREVRNKKRTGMRFFVNSMCKLANKYFLTVSEFSANSIHKYLGVPAQSIKVIHNSYRSNIDVIMSTFESKMVLTIGHLNDYKNPQTWILVVKKVLTMRPDIRFVWVGDGDAFEALQLEINQLGLEKQVFLPGYYQNVDDYYNRATIYFQPSLIESHGIAVVEAMAHGLPCVVSNIGGLPESVVDGETGFLCSPNDVECFSQSLLKLLNDPILRTRMGKAGQQRTEALFSEAIQEQKLMNMYVSVLKLDLAND